MASTRKTTDTVVSNAPARGPRTTDVVIPGPHTQAHENDAAAATTTTAGPAINPTASSATGPAPVATTTTGPVVDPLSSAAGPVAGVPTGTNINGEPQPTAMGKNPDGSPRPADEPLPEKLKHKIEDSTIGNVEAWVCTCGFRTLADEQTAKDHAKAANA